MKIKVITSSLCRFYSHLYITCLFSPFAYSVRPVHQFMWRIIKHQLNNWTYTYEIHEFLFQSNEILFFLFYFLNIINGSNVWIESGEKPIKSIKCQMSSYSSTSQRWHIKASFILKFLNWQGNIENDYVSLSSIGIVNMNLFSISI